MTTIAIVTKCLKEDEATSKENSDAKNKSPVKVIKKCPSNGDLVSVRARRVDPSPNKRACGKGKGLGEVKIVQRNVGSESRSRSPKIEKASGVGRGAIGKSLTTMIEKIDSKPIGIATAEGQSDKEKDGNSDVLEQ
ncbi:hypothetical protein CRYUN_Cryun10bG0073600 [Craigia yunnanensis]